jgi:nucleotide-binding universal stress UspA family protein
VSQPFRIILTAVDFSECSDSALDVAIGLAKTFGAKLHVVHSFELPIPAVSPYEVAIPDAYLEETRKAAQRRLEEAGARARAQGLEVQTHLTEGSPSPAIVRVAEKVGADLLVMGTHGHTGLKHLVLGSVAERTQRHAPCSVLTVKGGKR